MRAALALLFVAATGCGAVAGTAEYGLYRRAAAAPKLEDRLAAADDYVHKYPDGAFSDEVRAWFKHAEVVYWRSKRGSGAGLAAYLRTLPAGPHGVDAAQRLAAIQAKTEKGDELVRAGLATEAKLGRASAERARVRDEVSNWVSRFLEPRAFQVPISTRVEVLVPWTLSVPSPRCEERFDRARPGLARRCTKVEQLAYLVVGPKGGEPREATLELALEEDAHERPLRLTLAGPELFIRLEETAVVRRFDPRNSDHRMAGIARAVALLRAAFAKSVGTDPACEKQVVAPVVLELACRGVRLRATAGTEPGDDDVIVVQPE